MDAPVIKRGPGRPRKHPMGTVIRQESSGVEVVREGGKRKVKPFGDAASSKLKAPPGKHLIRVPVEQTDGAGMTAQDYMDLGYEMFSDDTRLVGKPGHVMLMCDQEDYLAGLADVEEISNPINRMSDVSLKDSKAAKGVGGPVYKESAPVPIGGTRVVQTSGDVGNYGAPLSESGNDLGG